MPATFRGVIRLDGKAATGIAVPEETVLGLGAGKRVPIVVTLGEYSYRTTVSPYRGEYMVPVSAEVRAGAGVSAGDELDVTIEVDSAPREVEVPLDLAAALDAVASARAAFDALSYSHRRAHVLAVEGAKSPDTRQRRVAKVVEALGGWRRWSRLSAGEVAAGCYGRCCLAVTQFRNIHAVRATEASNAP